MKEPSPAPLANFRGVHAFVLLGDPGAGKTTALQQEREALGDQAHYLSARDFLTFAQNQSSGYQNKVLFIDGLDEIRSMDADKRSALSQICKKLGLLGKPRFRLSCREADWLGDIDFEQLRATIPSGQDLKIIRLLPLGDEDIRSILKDRNSGDADELVQCAHRAGLFEILRNPQNLDFFAECLARGFSPESRRQIFEDITKILVSEHSEEHRQGRPADWNREQMLDAAGCRCSVFLISGLPNLPHFPLSEERILPCPDPNLSRDKWERYLERVVSTRLFCSDGDGWMPVHRHIAEFVSARYLAKLIQTGLSIQRLLGLMSGEDDVVVAELTGLSAWLAAHSAEARSKIIRRDPVGVALYGDLTDFSDEEKVLMLRTLCNEGVRNTHGNWYWTDMAMFQRLVTRNTESVFLEILQSLQDEIDSADHQKRVIMILRILQHGTPLIGLRPAIWELVNSRTWGSAVYYDAVKAVFQTYGGEAAVSGHPEDLKNILEDVQKGAILDPDYEIRGLLLKHLYPGTISPDELWDYLHKQKGFAGKYWRFWGITLFEKSGDEEIQQLLDAWTERSSELMPVIIENHWGIVLSDMLGKGLCAHGETLTISRLYDWLASCTRHGYSSVQVLPADVSETRNWLTQHPEIQKQIILEGVQRCVNVEHFVPHMYEVDCLLQDAHKPVDYGYWCLKQAVANISSPEISKYFFRKAVDIAFYDPQANDLSMETLEEHVARHELLQEEYRGLVSCSLDSPIARSYRKSQRYLEQDQEAIFALHEAVVQQREAIERNEGPWDILVKIAMVYLEPGSSGGYSFAQCEGVTGIERLNVLLGRDAQLVEIVQSALRHAIERDDLPRVEDVFRKKRENQLYLASFPVLAGLLESSHTLQRLTKDQVRTALAFCYTTAVDGYEKLLEAFACTHPDTTTEMFVQYTAIAMKGDSDLILGCDSPQFLQAKQRACIPLLKTFPKICRSEQTRTLAYLLHIAIENTKASDIEELISEKLNSKRMNVAQRACWLAAGLVVKPAHYAPCLNEFLEQRNRRGRIRNVVHFFERKGFIARMSQRPEDSGHEFCLHLELLVRHVGRLYAPWEWPVGEVYAQNPHTEVQASGLVESCIRALASSLSNEAGEKLKDLSEDTELSKWQTHLEHARIQHKASLRNVRYQVPDVEDLANILKSKVPVSEGDLMATLIEGIDDIAGEIRGDELNWWRAYLNEGSHSKPVHAKLENSCRDMLLSDLKKQSQIKSARIQISKEQNHAGDSRSDLCGIFEEFRVPIEIKMSDNREVEEALEQQLIAKYACDSHAKGHGIYLVLWSGKTPSLVAGRRPQDAREMQRLLRDQIPLLEARKVKVRVLDVSPPQS